MLLELSAFQNLALLLLRFAMGAIFLYHGYYKLSKWGTVPGFIKFLGIAEFLGALATIFGLLTQFANLGFILVMLGAMYMKWFKWHARSFGSEKSEGMELNLLIIGAALLLVVSGAGSLSLDAMLGFWP